MGTGTVVVVGGTQGLGRELAQSYANEGRDVVVTGRDPARAEAAADEIGGGTRGIGFDLAEPHAIAERLADVGDVEFLVLAAIERDTNRSPSTTSRARCGSSRSSSSATRRSSTRYCRASATRPRS